MEKDLFGAAKLGMLGFKKQFRGAILAVTLGAAIPATTQAIDLENSNLCSSGITNMTGTMSVSRDSDKVYINSTTPEFTL